MIGLNILLPRKYKKKMYTYENMLNAIISMTDKWNKNRFFSSAFLCICSFTSGLSFLDRKSVV